MTLQVASPGVYAFKKVSENEALPPDTTDSPRWYCKVCEGIEAIGIEEMLQDKAFPQNGIWGDIVCMGCFTILSAVRVDEPGTYACAKVAKPPEHGPLPGRKRTASKNKKDVVGRSRSLPGTFTNSGETL